jgi:hypothetical protein
MPLSTDLRLIREYIALAAKHAKQQREIIKLATGHQPDPVIMAEWRGQFIAFSRILGVIDGTIASAAEAPDA